MHWKHPDLSQIWHEVQLQVWPTVGASVLDNHQQMGVWPRVPSEQSYADIHNLPFRTVNGFSDASRVPALLVKHELHSNSYCMKIFKLNTGL